MVTPPKVPHSSRRGVDATAFSMQGMKRNGVERSSRRAALVMGLPGSHFVDAFAFSCVLMKQIGEGWRGS